MSPLLLSAHKEVCTFALSGIIRFVSSLSRSFVFFDNSYIIKENFGDKTACAAECGSFSHLSAGSDANYLFGPETRDVGGLLGYL